MGLEREPIQIFPRPFQIIAHRGASGYAPENTLAAFRLARELGAAEVELDVMLTGDDQVVLFHDADLDRKTNLTGAVRDYPMAELVSAEIGAWFDETHPAAKRKFAGTRVDPLERLFSELGRTLFYHVELKDAEPGLPAATLAVIDRFGLRDRVILTSFSLEQLERIRSLAPDLPTCLLISPDARREGSTLSWIQGAAEKGFTQVGVASRELTREHVVEARKLGLLIRAWAIKSDEDMEHAIAVGSNGMTINWPEKLIRRFVEHGGSLTALASRR
jgi:glycerophosphoryl diester phosphodiesterase